MDNNRYILGKILEHVGKELQNPESELCQSFVLANTQLEALVRLLKIASSPQTHILWTEDLAYRYDVSERTIRNWVRKELIPQARRQPSGNTPYWLSHEMEEVDEYLIRHGYVRRDKVRNVDLRLRDLLNRFA